MSPGGTEDEQEPAVQKTARDPFAVDQARAVEVLWLSWGDAYDISFEDGQYTAVSRDEEKRRFTGATSDELNHAIRADWARGAGGTW